MTLKFQSDLSLNQAFQSRTAAAAVQASVAVTTEVLNEVQSLSFGGTVTGGTYTLTYAGQTTTSLAFNANAAAVQTALQALSTVGSGGVVATGGPGPGTATTITFTGTNGAQALNLITTTSSLTGTSPTVTVTRTTAGVSVVNHTARAALAKAVLNGTGPSLANLALAVAGGSTVQADFNADFTPAATEAVISTDMQNQMNSVFGSFA